MRGVPVMIQGATRHNDAPYSTVLVTYFPLSSCAPSAEATTKLLQLFASRSGSLTTPLLRRDADGEYGGPILLGRQTSCSPRNLYIWDSNRSGRHSATGPPALSKRSNALLRTRRHSTPINYATVTSQSTMGLSSFQRVPLEVVERIANYTIDSVPHVRFSSLLALIKASRVCHAAGTRTLYRAIYIGAYTPAPILETLAANVDYARRVRSVWFFAPQRDVVPGHGDDFEKRLLEAFAKLTLVRTLHVAHGCDDLLLGLATIRFPLLRAVHLDKFGPRAAAFIALHTQLETLDADYTPRHPQDLPLPFLANLSVFRGACSLAARICQPTQPLTRLRLTEEDDRHGASRVFASFDAVSTLRAVEIDWFSWHHGLMDALSPPDDGGSFKKTCSYYHRHHF
ncbi:hypothetical protein MIND_00564300 [Mycena indigotica]|uniref:Uncharacterized protein n=1 Tax=Mycena indigotica TaxID=2126181 RepID=A0A8H6SP08_9AGAR|nr:uncharacterized protein MIND_00564300 [Mycena indigotica]KAF7303365.1 hypothetical protein MIND_00564300 [Mycena indigotica]